MRRRLHRLTTLAVCAIFATALACLLPLWWARWRPVPPTPVDPAQVRIAVEQLAQLTVTEPLPLDGYDREFFGQPWFDVDGNGCDTRNDVLAIWLTDVRTDPTQPCLVVSGTLFDPYTGEVVAFARGPTSADVQIDHVVALADAWSKGAAGWTSQQALAFANDVANLLPTQAGPNQDKSAADAASWLPPNRGYRCAYVVQQVRIKAAYGLGVTSEEYAAMAQVLQGCPQSAASAHSGTGAPMSAAAVSLAGRTFSPGADHPITQLARRRRCCRSMAPSCIRHPISRRRRVANSKCCPVSMRCSGGGSGCRSPT